MPRKHVGLCVVALRPAFFACLVLLVLLSWLPGDAMVRTGIGGQVEHAVAYFGTAVIMALAYREWPRLHVQTLLLVVLAGILEVGQLYVPGRSSAFLDFAASSAGVIIGGLLMWLVRPRVLIYLALQLPFCSKVSASRDGLGRRSPE
jgi:VanZ family protein